MNNAIQLTENIDFHQRWSDTKRTDWTLRPEEFIQGMKDFEVKKLSCEPYRFGTYQVSGECGRDFLFIVFNLKEMLNTYIEVFEYDWPIEVGKDLENGEILEMFWQVKEYMDVDYHNGFTEDKVMTIYASKKTQDS